MIDFLKSQLLLVVIGVGVVSGGTGWVAKGQFYGDELNACQVLLAEAEEKGVNIVGGIRKSMRGGR